MKTASERVAACMKEAREKIDEARKIAKDFNVPFDFVFEWESTDDEDEMAYFAEKWHSSRC